MGAFENVTGGLFITTCQQSCGKLDPNVFSHSCLSVHQGGIITHDGLELTMQRPH